MHTDYGRINISLPQGLIRELEDAVGPRKKSAFIAEAIRERLERVQRERMEIALAEGYAVTREEGLRLTREFEPCDLEGLDEDY